MKRLNWGLLLVIFLSIALWILFLSLICCSSLHAPATQVVFDGPIYAYSQHDSTYFSVSVRNIGQKTAYNVIATMLVKKNGAYTGLYELDYGLIPPKETETLEKQIRNVQFKDDIEVTGTLKWD